MDCRAVVGNSTVVVFMKWFAITSQEEFESSFGVGFVIDASLKGHGATVGADA